MRRGTDLWTSKAKRLCWCTLAPSGLRHLQSTPPSMHQHCASDGHTRNRQLRRTKLWREVFWRASITTHTTILEYCRYWLAQYHRICTLQLLNKVTRNLIINHRHVYFAAIPLRNYNFPETCGQRWSDWTNTIGLLLRKRSLRCIDNSTPNTYDPQNCSIFSSCKYTSSRRKYVTVTQKGDTPAKPI